MLMSCKGIVKPGGMVQLLDAELPVGAEVMVVTLAPEASGFGMWADVGDGVEYVNQLREAGPSDLAETLTRLRSE